MADKRIATPGERPSSKEIRQYARAGVVQGVSMEVPQGAEPSGIHPGEQIDESRKLRRLQIMISMVMSVISQDPDLTVEEAAEMAANARRSALAMFPGKELAYDILYKPRLQRLMNERFRLQ